jgi:hypothetical protein
MAALTLLAALRACSLLVSRDLALFLVRVFGIYLSFLSSGTYKDTYLITCRIACPLGVPRPVQAL